MPTQEESSVAPMPSLADRFGGDEAAATVAGLPEVAEAHEGGADSRGLHAAVLRARKQATSLERPAIDEVLRRRRAFAMRIGSAPGMFTLNGIGTRLYGAAEPNRHDGTSIATLFLTLIYVPVLPLASYLVRPAGGGVLRRSWQFFAKVTL